MEPGRETDKERVRERQRESAIIRGLSHHASLRPLWVTDEVLHDSIDTDEAKDLFLIENWQDKERKLR